MAANLLMPSCLKNQEAKFDQMVKIRRIGLPADTKCKSDANPLAGTVQEQIRKSRKAATYKSKEDADTNEGLSHEYKVSWKMPRKIGDSFPL